MKYIILENRLHKLIVDYLDELCDKSEVNINNYDITIVSGEGDDFKVLFDYDRNNEVLWDEFESLELFGLDYERLSDIIKNWFENKFNVKVSLVRPPFK